MAVILEERGRGKFKPAPEYNVNEVRELLNKKIEEEREAFENCSEEIDLTNLAMILKVEFSIIIFRMWRIRFRI